MEITDFFELSIGRWRSQRSAHHLAFHHFEEVNSEIEILKHYLNLTREFSLRRKKNENSIWNFFICLVRKNRGESEKVFFVYV